MNYKEASMELIECLTQNELFGLQPIVSVIIIIISRRAVLTLKLHGPSLVF